MTGVLGTGQAPSWVGTGKDAVHAIPGVHHILCFAFSSVLCVSAVQIDAVRDAFSDRAE